MSFVFWLYNALGGSRVGSLRYAITERRGLRWGDGLYYAEADEPRVAEAVATARKRLPELLTRIEEGDNWRAIRFRRTSPGGRPRSYWSFVQEVVDGDFIVYKPEDAGFLDGGTWSVAPSQVEDWVFGRGKRGVQGGFSCIAFADGLLARKGRLSRRMRRDLSSFLDLTPALRACVEGERAQPPAPSRTLAHQLRTDRFNLSVIGADWCNPGCFGEDFADWMRAELSRRGVVADEPIEEDWGWLLEASDEDGRYLVCFAGIPADDPAAPNRGDWHVTVERRPSLAERLRGRGALDPLASLPRGVAEILGEGFELVD